MGSRHISLWILLTFAAGCGDDTAPQDAALPDGAMERDAAATDAPTDSANDAELADVRISDSGNGDAGMDADVDDGPLKAFPSAYGAGANTIGGRGGRVVHVTTLDFAAPGGLQEALELTEPRTIVFDVSGSIEVPDYFWTLSGPRYSNLTIAGQTAPEGGINIVSYGKFGLLNMNDVIVRYVRFIDKSYFHARQGNWQALDVSGNHGLVLDHCSFRYTWNTANLVATDNNRDIGQNAYSIQRNMFGESGSTGVLLGASAQRPTKGGDNSFHHNAFYNTSHRFPNTGGNGNFEVFNNVVYNWANRLSSFYNDGTINHQGNYFLPGPRSAFFVGDYGGRSYGNFMHQLGGSFTGTIYTANNRYVGFDDAIADQWLAIFAWIGLAADRDRFEGTEVPAPLGVETTVTSADEAFDDVLADVGANAYLNADGTVTRYLDEVDTTYIRDIREGTQSYTSNASNFEYRRMSDEANLTYPELRNTRPDDYDTDRDGMPNVWEEAMGFDPDVADDALDHDDDGYTNLEEFLNQVDR